MKKQKGMFTFETIILLSFLGLLFLTGLAVYRQYSLSQTVCPSDKTPIEAYSRVLSAIRDDILLATDVQTSEHGFVFQMSTDVSITYKIVAGVLWRLEGDLKKTILMYDIEKFKFKIHPKNKLLFSVYLYPKNKMFIPFYTSFALRGQKNEGGRG